MTALRTEFIAIVLLALATASALAQTGDQQTPVTGPPQTLQPADQTAPAASGMEAVPSNSNDNAVVPAKPSVMGTRGAAAVEVGALGTVEGPPVGTLNNSNGGLGYGMWEGSNRATMETMLNAAPAATPSPSERILLRSLLLTTAPPPAGRWHTPFTSLRIEKLLEAGMIDEAADLAAQMQSSTNADIAHAQAEALLYAGRDEDACGDATAYRLQSAEPFWIELRAYCYAVANDAGALELTRAVLSAQQFQDDAFMTLLNAMTGAKPKLPIAIVAPNAVHVRMLERLKLPLSQDIVNLGGPAAMVALRSPVTPLDMRLAAAEKLLRAGALSPEQFSQVLALIKFKPKELTGAAAMAANEPILQGLARLRAALQMEKDAGRRAELIYTALHIGVQQGLFAQVADQFGDDAAALRPSPDWSNWAPLMARGLLLAGKLDAAGLWQAMMSQSLPQASNAIYALQLTLTLAVPNALRDAQSQAALSWYADQAFGPNATPGVQARAALYLGLFEALGRPMGPQFQPQLASLINSGLPGRRPPPALLARAEAASLAGRRGEAVLAMINAMGREGPAGLAPDVTVRFVRALQTLGLHDLAHMLAIEAAVIPARGAVE